MSVFDRNQMGLDFGLNTPKNIFKRKFRWLLYIPTISADGTNCLPPSKSQRPTITIKETEVQHLNEIVYTPVKSDWKPISLTLYDIKNCPQNSWSPVFSWLQRIYNPGDDTAWWRAQNDVLCLGSNQTPGACFKVDEAILNMYDGCGNVIEQWIMENVWPTEIEFGDLDMGSSEVCTIQLSLRYDRAYLSDLSTITMLKYV